MSTLNIKELKDKVRFCLDSFPQTKGNDNYLVMSVWKNFYRNDYLDFVKQSLKALNRRDLSDEVETDDGNLHKLPSFESIGRVRRKFNEVGLFLPSDETMRQRGRKIAQVQDDIRNF